MKLLLLGPALRHAPRVAVEHDAFLIEQPVNLGDLFQLRVRIVTLLGDGLAQGAYGMIFLGSGKFRARLGKTSESFTVARRPR